MINIVITCDRCFEINYKYTSVDGNFILPVGWVKLIYGVGLKIYCNDCSKKLELS